MHSPVLAILWENWRLTCGEAAWRLAVGIVAASAVLVWFAAVAPNEAARSLGATVALGFIAWWHSIAWVSIAKLNGGRFMDGYRPGFPFHLLYTRPVRTSVLVAASMAYQAASAAALYLVTALLLGAAFGYPFPLLLGAWLATLLLMQAATNWSTRSRLVQWVGMTVAYWACVLLALRRAFGEEIAPAAFHPDRWPTLFDFSLADSALIASISLVSFGLTVAGVARQRRGDARAAIPRTVEWRGFSDWLADLFRFPCPTTSATRAQVWFDLKSSGLPVLAIGGALAIVIPLLFVVTTRLDVALSGVFTEPFTRGVALAVAMFSLPAMLVLFGGNAFGIRARQGRTYASAFEATQACGTARMAGIKVLVRSVCLLAALGAVGASAWTSLSVIPFDVFEDNDTFIEKSRNPTSGLMRAIDGAVGAMSAYELLALVFVTGIVVAAMVASRAALKALGTRYPRRVKIAGSLLLLCGLALVLLALAGQRGIGPEIPLGAILLATSWAAASAIVLATGYLLWRGFAEQLLRLRHACGAVLVSAAFGAALVAVLRAAGVQLAGMPTTDAVWMLSPALLPLTVSVLAPWSLSRVRHT